jgi:SAM-dependent methyltransferase
LRGLSLEKEKFVTSLSPTHDIQIQDQYSDFLIRAVDPYARAKYDILHKALGEVEGLSCLVIGAGSGEYACEVAARGARVLAVDIDQASLDLCRKTAAQYGVNLDYRMSSLENLELPEQWDRVIATDVIEHIENERVAVEKILSFTKSKGKIVITVPALNFLFGHHDEILGHFRRYTCSRVRKLFSGDCELLFLRYFGFFLIPVTLFYSVWARKPYPVASVGQEMKKKSLVGEVLKRVLNFEKQVPLPLGTSVLAIFRKN